MWPCKAVTHTDQVWEEKPGRIEKKVFVSKKKKNSEFVLRCTTLGKNKTDGVCAAGTDVQGRKMSNLAKDQKIEN